MATIITSRIIVPTDTKYENEKKPEMTAADREVLKTDYPEAEVSRPKADQYRRRRGSVRLARDLYRTKSEHDEFIEKGLRVRLPGQEGHTGTFSWLGNALRHLFASR